MIAPIYIGKKLYRWVCDRATRTWVVHGILAVLYTYAPLLVLKHILPFFDYYLPVGWPAVVTATLTYWYFERKEESDAQKHSKEWDKRATKDQVTWRNDGIGDRVGPLTNLFAALAAWLVS